MTIQLFFQLKLGKSLKSGQNHKPRWRGASLKLCSSGRRDHERHPCHLPVFILVRLLCISTTIPHPHPPLLIILIIISTTITMTKNDTTIQYQTDRLFNPTQGQKSMLHKKPSPKRSQVSCFHSFCTSAFTAEEHLLEATFFFLLALQPVAVAAGMFNECSQQQSHETSQSRYPTSASSGVQRRNSCSQARNRTTRCF